MDLHQNLKLLLAVEGKASLIFFPLSLIRALTLPHSDPETKVYRLL